jgi:UDP-N-acetylmuramate--alanine ligase
MRPRREAKSDKAAPVVPDHVHFVGLGGIGVSALARILLQRGHRVSGSDLKDSPLLERLRVEGAEVFIGHDADQPGDARLVVATAAASDDNPELLEARRRGLPTMKRAEMLGRLMDDCCGIAVAGSHGKTTTAAAIGYLLYRASLDPTIWWAGDGRFRRCQRSSGEGTYFVAEADEYDAFPAASTSHRRRDERRTRASRLLRTFERS